MADQAGDSPWAATSASSAPAAPLSASTQPRAHPGVWHRGSRRCPAGRGRSGEHRS